MNHEIQDTVAGNICQHYFAAAFIDNSGVYHNRNLPDERAVGRQNTEFELFRNVGKYTGHCQCDGQGVFLPFGAERRESGAFGEPGVSGNGEYGNCQEVYLPDCP